jgi:hypothetical protein
MGKGVDPYMMWLLTGLVIVQIFSNFRCSGVKPPNEPFGFEVLIIYFMMSILRVAVKSFAVKV